MPHGALYLAVMVNVVARGEHDPDPTGYASAAAVVGGAFAILCQTLQFSSSVTVWREGCTPLLAPNQGTRCSSLLLRQRSSFAGIKLSLGGSYLADIDPSQIAVRNYDPQCVTSHRTPSLFH